MACLALARISSFFGRLCEQSNPNVRDSNANFWILRNTCHQPHFQNHKPGFKTRYWYSVRTRSFSLLFFNKPAPIRTPTSSNRVGGTPAEITRYAYIYIYAYVKHNWYLYNKYIIHSLTHSLTPRLHDSLTWFFHSFIRSIGSWLWKLCKRFFSSMALGTQFCELLP